MTKKKESSVITISCLNWLFRFYSLGFHWIPNLFALEFNRITGWAPVSSFSQAFFRQKNEKKTTTIHEFSFTIDLKSNNEADTKQKYGKLMFEYGTRQNKIEHKRSPSERNENCHLKIQKEEKKTHTPLEPEELFPLQHTKWHSFIVEQ